MAEVAKLDEELKLKGYEYSFSKDLSGRLKIVCRGGDAVKIMHLIFIWIKRLFIRKKQPVYATIQVVNSIIILNIRKD